MEHQRREAAIGDGGGNDLASKRKQQSRALDHQKRPEIFLGNIAHAEYAGVIEVEGEQHIADQFGLALKLKLHLEIGGGKLPRIDIDLNRDLRLLLLLQQGIRRVWIFEGKILGVLDDDTDVRSRV